MNPRQASVLSRALSGRAHLSFLDQALGHLTLDLALTLTPPRPPFEAVEYGPISSLEHFRLASGSAAGPKRMGSHRGFRRQGNERSRKKLPASIRGFTEWIRKNRHQKLKKLMKTLGAKYPGYWNYYGLIGNSESLQQFYWASCQLLFKWLNRRSQRGSYTWRAFNRLLRRFRVPAPRMVETERKQRAIPCCWGWKLGQILARYMDLRPA